MTTLMCSKSNSSFSWLDEDAQSAFIRMSGDIQSIPDTEACVSRPAVGGGLFLGSLAVLSLLVACGGGVETGASTVLEEQASTTAAHVSSTTTSLPPSEPASNLDLSAHQWVTLGRDGLVAADGTVVWPASSQFDKAVARDRAGGLVFVEGSNLLWFAEGRAEPVLVVQGVPGRLVEVVSAGGEMVAALGYEEFAHFRLSDGTGVPDLDGYVAVEQNGAEVWSAANGWSVWIEGPSLANADEGTPTEVLTHARLQIADETGEMIGDQQIGTDDEAWVRIHDFDGRRLIVSRGPIEPAAPPETFFVVDLSCATCTTVFTAALTSATLVHQDTDWDGPLEYGPQTFVEQGS